MSLHGEGIVRGPFSSAPLRQLPGYLWKNGESQSLGVKEELQDKLLVAGSSLLVLPKHSNACERGWSFLFLGICGAYVPSLVVPYP